MADSSVLIAVPDVGSSQVTDVVKESATTRLDVRREELDDVVLLHLRGEVDLSNVDVLERALQQVCSGDAYRQVIVDATAITFPSVAGVAALEQAQAKGLDFALVATQRAVLLPLQVTGMDQLLKVFPSLEAARRTG